MTTSITNSQLPNYEQALLIKTHITTLQNLISKKLFDQAISLCRKVQEISPKNVEILNFYAYCKKQMASSYSELLEAARYYEEALSVNPQHILTNFNYGEYFYDLKQYQNSLKHFDKAYKQAQGDSKIGYNIGMCYLQLGQEDQAMHYFKKAGQASKPHLDAKINQSILLRKQGKPQEALEILDNLSKLFPFNAKVLLNYNVALLQQTSRSNQHHTLIEENFKKIFLVDPLNQNAWFNQGVYQFNQLKFDAALESFLQVKKVEKISGGGSGQANFSRSGRDQAGSIDGKEGQNLFLLSQAHIMEIKQRQTNFAEALQIVKMLQAELKGASPIQDLVERQQQLERMLARQRQKAQKKLRLQNQKAYQTTENYQMPLKNDVLVSGSQKQRSPKLKQVHEKNLPLPGDQGSGQEVRKAEAPEVGGQSPETPPMKLKSRQVRHSSPRSPSNRRRSGRRSKSPKARGRHNANTHFREDEHAIDPQKIDRLTSDQPLKPEKSQSKPENTPGIDPVLQNNHILPPNREGNSSPSFKLENSDNDQPLQPAKPRSSKKEPAKKKPAKPSSPRQNSQQLEEAKQDDPTILNSCAPQLQNDPTDKPQKLKSRDGDKRLMEGGKAQPSPPNSIVKSDFSALTKKGPFLEKFDPDAQSQSGYGGSGALSQSVQQPEIKKWTEDYCNQRIRQSKNDYLAFYRLAQIFFKQKRQMEAVENLVQVNKINQKYKPLKIVQAIANIYFGQQKYAKAIPYFKKLIKDEFYGAPMKDRKKLEPEMKIKIGKCLEFQGKLSEAQKIYEQIVYDAPSQWKAIFRNGLILVKQNEIKRGIDELVKARSIVPKNNEIKIRLAEALLMDTEEQFQVERNIEYAIDLLKEVNEELPQNWLALSFLARAHEKKKAYLPAVEYFKPVLEKSPTQENQFFMAMLHSNAEWHEKSIYYLEKLINENQESADSTAMQKWLIELGTSYGILGDFEKTIQTFEKVIKINPLNEKANYLLGKILYKKQKDLDGAMQCFKRINQVTEKNFKSWYYMGLIYYQKKKLKKSYNAMKSCVNLNQEFSEAWKVIGDIYFTTKKFDKALKSYKKAYKYNRNDIDAQIGMGNCFQELEDLQSAIKIFLQVLDKEKSWEIHYLLGNCYYENSEAMKAIEQFGLTLKLNDQNSDCWYNMGNAYCIINKFKEAINSYKEATKLNPENSTAYYNMGNAHMMISDYDKAIVSFEKAISLAPKNIGYRIQISDVYKSRKEWEKALQHLKKAQQGGPNNWEVFLKVGEVYMEKGDLQQAEEHLKMALKTDATNKEVQNAMERLRGLQRRKKRKSSQSKEE